MWVKRQTDGELDDTRLTEGLTGEAAVYKRRGMEKPEPGRPQVKYVSLTFLASDAKYRLFFLQAKEAQVHLRLECIHVSIVSCCSSQQLTRHQVSLPVRRSFTTEFGNW